MAMDFRKAPPEPERKKMFVKLGNFYIKSSAITALAPYKGSENATVVHMGDVSTDGFVVSMSLHTILDILEKHES